MVFFTKLQKKRRQYPRVRQWHLRAAPRQPILSAVKHSNQHFRCFFRPGRVSAARLPVTIAQLRYSLITVGSRFQGRGVAAENALAAVGSAFPSICRLVRYMTMQSRRYGHTRSESVLLPKHCGDRDRGTSA